MPSPSTSRQRTSRITRTIRTPLRVVSSGTLPEPERRAHVPHRFVLIRMPWTRAAGTTNPITATEQRAA